MNEQRQSQFTHDRRLQEILPLPLDHHGPPGGKAICIAFDLDGRFHLKNHPDGQRQHLPRGAVAGASSQRASCCWPDTDHRGAVSRCCAHDGRRGWRSRSSTWGNAREGEDEVRVQRGCGLTPRTCVGGMADGTQHIAVRPHYTTSAVFLPTTGNACFSAVQGCIALQSCSVIILQREHRY